MLKTGHMHINQHMSLKSGVMALIVDVGRRITDNKRSSSEFGQFMEDKMNENKVHESSEVKSLIHITQWLIVILHFSRVFNTNMYVHITLNKPHTLYMN